MRRSLFVAFAVIVTVSALGIVIAFPALGATVAQRADVKVVRHNSNALGGSLKAAALLSVFASGAHGGRAAALPLLLNGTVVTMDDRHDVIEDGHVLVRGSVIEAVWSGPTPAGISTDGARVVDAGVGGLIFPGLINLHDHPAFSVLPLWPAPASHQEPQMGRFTGREPYDYRYEWNTGSARPAEYMRLVRNAKFALAGPHNLDLLRELTVHAEASAALGGETAIQGEDESSANGLIVRDAEGTNFGVDHVEARVASVDDETRPWGEDDDKYSAASDLASAIAQGDIDAWFVHLAEGVRDADRQPGDFFSSRHEFATLVEQHLLTPETVIVHGTALERSDFERMSEAQAKLVWSPLSNLLLYGRTTNVYDALAAGVTVSLGTDWAPSGSRTLLDELKVADIALRDQRVLGGFRGEVPALESDAALDRALVDMVTRNPAQTLKWAEVGSIETGKHADLLLLSRPPDSPTGGMLDSPYRNLIDATERDVRLVVVDGRPVAGDLDALQAAGATGVTSVHSTTGAYTKGVAFRAGEWPRGLSLGRVESTLTVALRALGGDGAAPASGQPTTTDFTYLREHWDHGTYKEWTNETFYAQVLLPFAETAGGLINLERIEKTPLMSDDDRFFFTIVEGRLTETGLPDDPTPPFHLYPANVNQARAGTNPLTNFRKRWYS